MKWKALVTGGAGFIGSHVANELVEGGHEVVVLDDLSGGFEENLPRGVEFIQGSVANHELVNSLFTKFRFEYIYHFAAYAAEGLSHFIKRFNYTNNIIGSINLINAAVNFNSECIVFTSSIAVYGENQVPMREDLVPHPEDSYGIAKRAVELDLEASHRLFGLRYVIFRPHNVYGEKQNVGDKYRNVVGIFMNQIMQGKPMTIYGDGEQTRAFTYIKDIAPVIARAPDTPLAQNQIFNIGSDAPVTVNKLSTAVAEAMGVNPQVVHFPARREVFHAFSDHAKIRSVFGALPQTGLEEGLEKMALWVKRVGPRKSSDFKDIEITKNLPANWAVSE